MLYYLREKILFKGVRLEKNTCPNCGAPIDIEKKECPYCGTKYVVREAKTTQEQIVRSENIQKTSSFEDKNGCLNMIVTLGLISLFTRRPPRPPRR